MSMPEVYREPPFIGQYRSDRSQAFPGMIDPRARGLEVNSATDSLADQFAEPLRMSFEEAYSEFAFDALQYLFRKAACDAYIQGSRKYAMRVEAVLEQEFGNDSGFMDRLRKVLGEAS